MSSRSAKKDLNLRQNLKCDHFDQIIADWLSLKSLSASHSGQVISTLNNQKSNYFDEIVAKAASEVVPPELLAIVAEVSETQSLVLVVQRVLNLSNNQDEHLLTF